MENTNNDLFENKGPAEQKPDPVLGELLDDEVYSIQIVPGDGSCFYYTITMIVAGYTENYFTEFPNKIVRSTMDCLRSICAHTIYQDLEVLQLQYIEDYTPPKNKDKKKIDPEEYLTEVGKMARMSNGKPNPQAYFNYFLKGENLPWANQHEISVVQHLPTFSHTLMLIYQERRNSGKPYVFICSMHIPDVVDDIVLIHRKNQSRNEHYEPIVFNVDGRWEHRLSVEKRFDPNFRRLFQAFYDQCPAVREKITF